MTGNRSLVERLRVRESWQLWLPALAALVVGAVVFLDGAMTPFGWMVSSLLVKFTIPYVLLVLVDVVLAVFAVTGRGTERQALVGITIATILAAAAVVLLATEVTAAVVILAALGPAWYATKR